MQNIISVCGTIFLISFLSFANLDTPESQPPLELSAAEAPDTSTATAGNAIPLAPRRPAPVSACMRTETMRARGLKGEATIRNPIAEGAAATATIISIDMVHWTMT